MKGKPNTIEQVWKVDYLQVSKEIHEKVTVALWRKAHINFFLALPLTNFILYTFTVFFFGRMITKEIHCLSFR